MQHAGKSSPMGVVDEYFWGKCSPCAGVTGQGNHFGFIPTVSVESQHSIGVPTCHDFPRFVIISLKSRPEVGNRWLYSSKNGVFWEKDPLRANFHKCFQTPTRGHGSMSFCANFVKSGRPEVGEIARYLMDKKQKQNFGSRSRCRFCADRAQNLSGIAPNNTIGVPQISSKSVHFRRSYSRTREHRSNAPQSCHKVFAILGEASASSPSN